MATESGDRAANDAVDALNSAHRAPEAAFSRQEWREGAGVSVPPLQVLTLVFKLGDDDPGVQEQGR
jgi:hypothetical protein